jgi:signal peptidase I
LFALALIATACSTQTIGGEQSCVGPSERFKAAAASMEPTIRVGQTFTVDLGAYKVAPLRHGDIVDFATPPSEVPIIMVKNLVKRIVGLPGETISSGPHAEVLINGEPLDQPWLTAANRSDPGPPIEKQRIPSRDLFVLGDNRGNSADSRFFGPIRISSVVGKVILSGCH